MPAMLTIAFRIEFGMFFIFRTCLTTNVASRIGAIS
jgi:hypothetical protein